MNKLGTFKITSGKAMITDPCYKRGTWCAGMLENVRNGDWNAYTIRSDEADWGIRNAELIAFHSDVDGTGVRWKKTNIDVGVDSGQAGIFDEIKYPHGENEPERMAKYNNGKWNPEFEKFYDAACEATLGTDSFTYDPNFLRAGLVFDIGAVSSTGYGDGSYTCYTASRDGKIVGIRLVFLPKDERGRDIGANEVLPRPLPRREDSLFLDILKDKTLVLSDVETKILEASEAQYASKCKEVEEWNKANVRQ